MLSSLNPGSRKTFLRHTESFGGDARQMLADVFLESDQGDSLAKGGDQTQNTGGKAPSAHAVADDDRLTVIAGEASLNLAARFVSLLLAL